MIELAKFFIHRPAFAIVISLVILIAGGLSLTSLPVAQYPNITPPTVQVETTYVGANAKVVEESVATPIEQEVNGAQDMIYMSSKSTNDGRYVLTCTFKVGANLDIAAVDVQNRVSKAEAKLPADVNTYGISVKKQSPDMLMVVSLYSPDKTYDDLFLSNYAKLNLTDALARVPGVGNVMIVGEREYSMRVWLRPDRMAEMGLTASDISQAIREQNVQAPAGSLGQPPLQNPVDFQYSVNVKGRLTDPKEYNDIVIKANANGSILRVRDVARCEIGAKDYSSYGRLNGIPATVILIYQMPGANALDVAKGLTKTLKQVAQTFPPGMAYEISLDNTKFVTTSIEEVVHTLFEAAVLVLLVVLVFIGNFRSTLIPMMAVPVSLIGTFAMFVPLGFSVNLLTLFGLVLAIGLVVDDAIVVVEAVESKLEQGMNPTEATEQAMTDVSGAVVAIALVLCAVFVPVAFMGGITGQLYKQFALTLAISVVLSAIVALTLTPALCRLMLKERKHGAGGIVARLFGAFNWCFDRLSSAYLAIVGVCIRFALVSLVVLGLIAGSAVWLMKALPSGFVPEEDQGYVIAMFSLPDAASLSRTDAVVRKGEAFLSKLPGVKSVVAMGGFNVLTGTYASNTATIFIPLKPWDERTTEALSANGILHAVRTEFGKYPEAVSVSFNPPAIPGLGNAGGFQFELQDRGGGGGDPKALYTVAKSLLAEAAKSPQLIGLYNSYRAEVPQMRVELDREKTKTLGIPINTVFESLQTYLGGLQVNDFTLYGRTYKVVCQAESEFRTSPSDVRRIYVRGASGQMVPLSTLTRVIPETGPDLIQRYNLYRTAEISGSPAPKSSSGQAIAAMEEIAGKVLPRGFGFEWTGTAFQEKEAGGSQALIFVLAMVFVFLFLVAQYESWSIPFSVMLGIPLGVFGAFLSIWLRGLTNDVYAQIGLVMLIGLSAKNAILIVEFARERRQRGASLVDAAMEAAKLRFRPILMTSLAFILGVLPLVVAEGAGAASRHSLGTAVCGGMTAATFFGVFFIPVLYVAVESVSEWFGRLFSGKKPAGKEPDNAAQPASGEAETEKTEKA